PIIAGETAENIRGSVELMDQTDQTESLVNDLITMIEQKRLNVKIYTKGRLHAKAYIFDYGDIYDGDGNQIERHENGIAIVGSSNLSLAGIAHNTELNVVVQGNDNHAELSRWFDDLWKEAIDFNESLMDELKLSWAANPLRPYDIYMKTLYTLVKDRLEGYDDKEILWDDEITKRLADFQTVAVKQAIQMIRQYNGAFVADVVGLGKSYIGAAIVKHFERTEHSRTLIICPKPLVEMWDLYNEVYQLNARVLSMGMLKEDGGSVKTLVDDPIYNDRDFVLIDESHNLRTSGTQRYNVVQAFLATGRKCCFLTATPRNKSAWDVYNQIKLFHQDDITDLPIDPPNLRDYFKLIDQNQRSMPDLLANILVRRTRNHILRWYGYDSETEKPVDSSHFEAYQNGTRKAYVLVGGKKQFFPKRELETVEYSIEDTYQGLYEELRGYMGKAKKGHPKNPPKDSLCFARYGLWHFVNPDKKKKEPYASLHRAGYNLRGLIRILLFKRFESSVHAFQQTIGRLIRVHENFLVSLENGIVPAGEDAQRILYESDFSEESESVSALQKVTKRYDASDFDAARLRDHIVHDIGMLKRIADLVEPITPEKDEKLQTLFRLLKNGKLKSGKRLIFTQYADTAKYLSDNLNPDGIHKDIDVIFSGDKSKARVVGRFAPKSNPEYKMKSGETELMTVIATDVLSEGLNLQDCDNIINYDLHWNPVRLIQRFGRIDRIGSDHEVIYGYNFLPEKGIEKHLGLKEKLHSRIQEIHDNIGEDSEILDKTERLNEEAMYAIYEKNGGQLSFLEDDEGSLLDINEAEEIIRQLQRDEPEEFERISNLRDGIRACKPAASDGLFVFCQAGNFQQLYMLDENGNVETKEIPRILGRIKCGPELQGKPLPKDFNAAVMKVKEQFIYETKRRQAERDRTVSLSLGQRYVLKELRILFNKTDDENIHDQINELDKTFRKPMTAAINRELNRIRRNSLVDQHLLQSLIQLYHQHDMKDWASRSMLRKVNDDIPRIVCSEGLG
ncbi:MAG TPA: helicase, partial [Bacteroidetes bacterium]|nr:helicase [Bacteroidota bacterium]HEX04451.1 helicase [Bacteroidota bacterium]